MTLEVILAFESDFGKLAVRVKTFVRSFRAVFSLPVPDEVFLESETRTAPRLCAVICPVMGPRMPGQLLDRLESPGATKVATWNITVMGTHVPSEMVISIRHGYADDLD